jgi:Peptidase A4 family
MKRVLATAAAAVAAAAGLALAGVPAAAPAGAAGTAAARPAATAAVRPLVRASVTLPRTHLPHLTPGETTATSGNWSGWGDAANKGVALRYVQSDWNVPSVDCAASTLGSGDFAYNSDWVGLDGFNSSTVEQTGTTAYCDTSGAATYYAWYEMYPNPPVAFSGVAPGDAIDASVYFNGTSYAISLKDVTTGSTLPVASQRCPSGSTCKNSSAEVIVEDPGNSAPTFGLADFGQANFTSSQVTSRNGTKGTLAAGSLWKATQISMDNSSNGDILATAGPLQGGAAFVDSWVRSL